MRKRIIFDPMRRDRPSIDEYMISHDPRLIVTCPYCNNRAVLASGKVIYGEKWDGRNVWVCSNYPKCDAYVGVHPKTNQPLGRLADRELRKAKMRAHEMFDPLWRDGDMTRSEAYGWLSDKMEMPIEQCHIGMFDIERCERVVDIMKKESMNKKERKE